MSSKHPRRRSLLTGVILLAILCQLFIPSVQAVELPPTTASVYIQTNGPTGAIGLGDWYTNNSNGVVAGYHYFKLNIPCSWPAGLPVSIDLFSPAMYNGTDSPPLNVSEQPGADGALDAIYELYAAGTPVGPAPNQPAPGLAGASLFSQTYVPTPAAQTWVRFYTLPAPVACGSYVLRAEAGGTNQNGWRLRVGYDNDGDPNNAPPANYDNPDGIAGTDDEITVGIMQTSYQHDIGTAGVNQCLTLFQYVAPGQATAAFHNFDLDGNQRVRYYAPGAPYDPSGQTGGIVGTVSGNAVWNNSGSASAAVRGAGDVINNPTPGWWKIVTCANRDNQYIQEGQAGVAGYYSQPPTPQMTLTKDDGVTTVTPNRILTYTLAFTNTSNTTPFPGAATKVVLTDTLPAAATFLSCAINAPYTGTCNQNGQNVRFVLNQSVIAGAGGSVQVTAQINANANAGDVINTATLSYQDSLGNPFANANATDTDTILTDLAVSKTASSTSVSPGSAISYTITITNNGPGAITAAPLSDSVPSSITNVSWTCAATTGSSCATPSGAGNLINTTLNLLPDGVATMIVAGTVAPSATGQIVNTAAIAVPNGVTDTNPNNNSATATTTITQSSADLSLAMVASSVAPGVGQQITYTLVITNSGPNDTTNVQVRDLLPQGVTYVNANASQGSYTSGTGIWVVGSLAVNDTATLQIIVTVDTAGQIINTAEVTAADLPDPDSTPDNNNPQEDDQASVTITSQVLESADLAIAILPPTTTARIGDVVTYTIVVTNNGPDIASNAVITAALAADIYIESITPSQGTCNSNWNDATCDMGTLAVGATMTVTVEATILEAGTLTNTVSTGSSTPDPIPANNTATQVTTGEPVEQLVISKFHDDPFYAGSTGTFTITVINWGPSTPNVITVTDVLPSRLTFNGYTGDDWACNASGQIVTCIHTGPVPPEGGARVTLLTGVTPGASAIVTNTAIVTGPFVDSDPSDNTVEDPVTIIGQEGTVTGTIFNDINGNGSRDAGEPYLSGIGVVITGSTGITQTVTTDANGVYSATVVVGTTTVDVVDSTLPTGSRLTTANDPQTVNVTDGTTTTAPATGYQQPADLIIAMGVSNSTPPTGQQVTITLIATNGGPGIGTNVVVTDILPAGLQYVTAIASEGNYDDSNGIWTIGTMTTSFTATLQIVVIVTTNQEITNTATISGLQPDPDPSNNTANAMINGQQGTITGHVFGDTNGNATQDAGEPNLAGIRVLITNTTGLNQTVTTDANGNYTATVPSGAVTAAVVDASVPVGSRLTTANSTQTVNVPNAGTIATTPVGYQLPADLSLTQTVNTATPNVGDTVTFVITLLNSGPSIATNVTVHDSLPAGLIFVASTPGVGNYDPPTGTWTVGTLAVNASVTLTIQARVTTANPVINTAQVASSDQPDPDSTPNNNAANEDDQASVTVTGQQADLSLSKAVNNPNPVRGSTLVYTVTVHNSGPSTATGIRVSDPVPAGLTLVGFTASQGSYDSTTGIWTLGTLANGATASLQMVVTVASDALITNTAEIVAVDQPDPNSTPNNHNGNEDDQRSITVPSQVADLSLVSVVSATEPRVGDVITFTLRLTNSGPNTATNVSVSDQLTGGTYRSASPSQGQYDPATGIWQVGTLPVGASVTLEISVLVSSIDHITNTAQVSASDQFDPDSVPNNSNSSEDDQTTLTVTPLPGAAPPPAVPEPGTLALLGSGLAALAAYIR